MSGIIGTYIRSGSLIFLSVKVYLSKYSPSLWHHYVVEVGVQYGISGVGTGINCALTEDKEKENRNWKII